LGKGNSHQELIRAHPNFRQDGPWYDYVEVNYGPEGCFPARCACFFQWPEVLAEAEFKPGDVVALVQQSQWQTPAEKAKESQLYSHYTLESLLEQRGTRRVAKLHCVLASSLNSRLFAIDPTPAGDVPNTEVFTKLRTCDRGVPPPFSIIRVKDRKAHWPSSFLNPI
jgi:hypothetical protein